MGKRAGTALVGAALGLAAGLGVGGCGEDRGSLTIEGTGGEGTGTSPTSTAPTETETTPTTETHER